MSLLVMVVKIPVLAAVFIVCLSADDTLWIDLDNTKINPGPQSNPIKKF